MDSVETSILLSILGNARWRLKTRTIWKKKRRLPLWRRTSSSGQICCDPFRMISRTPAYGDFGYASNLLSNGKLFDEQTKTDVC